MHDVEDYIRLRWSLDAWHRRLKNYKLAIQAVIDGTAEPTRFMRWHVRWMKWTGG